VQAFVDDLLEALRVIAHGLCMGIEGGCPVCLAALEIALQKMAFLDKMMKECSFGFFRQGRHGYQTVSSLHLNNL
jgi:hypothetical protein